MAWVTSLLNWIVIKHYSQCWFHDYCCELQKLIMEFVTNSKSQWNYRYLRFTIKSRYIGRYIVFVLLLVSHEPHNFISKIYNEVIYVYIQYFFFREPVVNHFSAHQCEQCLMLSLLFLSKRIWTGTQSQSQLDKGEYLNGKIWCSAEREKRNNEEKMLETEKTTSGPAFPTSVFVWINFVLFPIPGCL